VAKGYTKSVARLMELLGHMPGVGEKTAERLAYHILRLSDAESDPCPVCADPRRDGATICVVEQAKDVVAIEQTGGYSGLYHVLGGRLAPLEGVEPQHLTVHRLLERVKDGRVKEVILATNPDMEGEATALYVREALEGLPVRVSRLARGIPSGSHLEYANASILADALEGRREMKADSRLTRNDR
jgi:recombination protein RecR